MNEIAMAELGEIARIRDESTIRGVPEPRIHTKLNDYPSYGEQMIKFCEEIGFTLMPWQQWLAHHSLKYKPDGSWCSSSGDFALRETTGEINLYGASNPI
jgi:hypothetical protein